MFIKKLIALLMAFLLVASPLMAVTKVPAVDPALTAAATQAVTNKIAALSAVEIAAAALATEDIAASPSS